MEEKISETDKCAFRLIEMMAWSLRQLNGGEKNLPSHWKNYIKKSLSGNKRGRNKVPEVQAEYKKIAHEQLKHELSYQRGDTGITPTKNAEGLADSYGYDRSDIFKIKKQYYVDAVAQEIDERLDAKEKAQYDKEVGRVDKLNVRILSEGYENVLQDETLPFHAYNSLEINKEKGKIPIPQPRLHVTDADRIKAWVLDGYQRGIRASATKYEVILGIDSDIADNLKNYK